MTKPTRGDVRWLKAGAFDAQGVGTYPTVKLVKRLGTLPQDHFEAIQQNVLLWLGFTGPR